MKFTIEQLTKAKQAKSAEELLTLAKESGMDLSEEQAKKAFAALNQQGELSDEELEQVAGGSWPWDWIEDFVEWLSEPDTYELSYDPLTDRYFCPDCGGQLERRGYEYSDEGEYDKYECGQCHAWFWHFRTGKYSGKWLKD